MCRTLNTSKSFGKKINRHKPLLLMRESQTSLVYFPSSNHLRVFSAVTRIDIVQRSTVTVQFRGWNCPDFVVLLDDNLETPSKLIC